MTNIAFVGRQPVFSPKLDVFGYELLYRSGNHESADIEDGDQATASVLINSLTDVGFDVVTESRQAFINVTRDFLLDSDLSCLPAKRVVLEVLENIDPSKDVIAAARKRAEEGFTIALDDFVYRPELEPLVNVADIVKIEFPQIPRDELSEHIARLRQLGVRTVLAEKLETYEEFELCKRLGCDLFQGYFFCRPQVLARPRPSHDVTSIVQLLARLQDADTTLRQVERLIRNHANMSYRLLRFVNSVSTGTISKIESVEHAIALLGLRRVRSLASMLLLASIDDDKPQELVKTAILRAKMCELQAEMSGHDSPGRYFTVGLLSVLDAILDLPMEQVIELLPLSSEMNDALLHRNGQLGRVLTEVIEFVSGKPSALTSDLDLTYAEALRWTCELAACP